MSKLKSRNLDNRLEKLKSINSSWRKENSLWLRIQKLKNLSSKEINKKLKMALLSMKQDLEEV